MTPLNFLSWAAVLSFSTVLLVVTVSVLWAAVKAIRGPKRVEVSPLTYLQHLSDEFDRSASGPSEAFSTSNDSGWRKDPSQGNKENKENNK